MVPKCWEPLLCVILLFPSFCFHIFALSISERPTTTLTCITKKVKRKKHKEKQSSYLFSSYFCNYKNE